jgi:hypothetical protein
MQMQQQMMMQQQQQGGMQMGMQPGGMWFGYDDEIFI